MTRPERRWIIPAGAWAASIEEMARDGARGVEGIAFWLGRLRDQAFEVTHVVGVAGASVVKEPDLLVVPAVVTNALTDLAISEDLFLGGQVHSHGGDWTDLSRTDKLLGFSAPSYLSVVAPHFAGRPGTQIFHCGVHVFSAGSGFRRLSIRQMEQRIAVPPGDVRFTRLEVGP